MNSDNKRFIKQFVMNRLWSDTDKLESSIFTTNL
jgi:hypothetical protein